tara:strand:+ start:17147 stop:17536 length:390 start_codon:yes stop_codon:yes gene_type:complete
MKVIINIIERPMFTEHTMFAKPDLSKLKETKTLTVQGSFITKTRIDTQMQIGTDRHGINFKVEGFKTDSVPEHSYFTGEWSYPEYFKKSKKQNVTSYTEYVKEVVRIALNDYLKVDLDEVTVNLILPTW